jgi:solute:Na+ symporter, SSS family
MQWIDWVVVVVPLLGILGVAYYTQRFVRGVADYISAGRCAGRYLLTSASGEAGAGVTNTVGNVEKYMLTGFVALFWDSLITPILLILAITGFVTYRYRQTRVLTLAQFFEERYSRRFRLFIGYVIFVAGALNYAVFPLASCLFFKAFLGLPDSFTFWGFAVSTNVVIMLSYLSVTLTMICFGGQVTLMITDCVEGIFSHLAYLVIIGVIFSMVSWQQMVDVMTGIVPAAMNQGGAALMAIAPQHSPIDPFDAFEVKDFNFYAVLLGMFGTAYLCGAWQGGHGFRSSALTPHEGRMAGILGSWRNYARGLMLLVVAIGSLTYLRHPDFADRANPLKARIAAVPTPSGKQAPTVSDATPVGSQAWFEGRSLKNASGAPLKSEDYQRQRQQAPFMALADMLPMGVKGLLLVVMIMGLIAGDGNHIISWSSVFVQDCVMPFRRKPFSQAQHMTVLRLGAIGVAAVAFCISLVLPLSTPIWIWWSVTGAIYNGGAGAILIGGLYWKRGTVQGAWSAVLLGLPLSLATVTISNNWWNTKTMLLHAGFPAAISSGFWLSFFVSVFCILAYVSVSWLTCVTPYDIKNRLARGHEDVDGPVKRQPLFKRLIGIDEHFTSSDRLIAILIFSYAMVMVGLVVFMVFWQFGMPRLLDLAGYAPSVAEGLRLGKHGWAVLWLSIGIVIPGVIAIVTMVWFSIGTVVDMKKFFKIMAVRIRDEHDDGTVR